MTTLTEPPLIDEPDIDVDELPALDQPDERVCEIPTVGDCDRSAAWVMSAVCPTCGSETRLACDEHKDRLLVRGAKCRVDQIGVQITRVEAL